MDPSQRLPNAPTASATVILARQKNAMIEVYLLRRNPASKAFPGFYVFPGGTLETDDEDTGFWLSHVDCANQPLIHHLGGEPEQTLPFAVAAIRETFEETGLLLASSADGNGVSEWPPRNHGVFSRQIVNHRLQLSVSRLGRWCRWITPESMAKRFDTFFFIVQVSPDQDCRPDNQETIHGIWIDPASALVRNNQGTCPLSPPTLVSLQQLLGYKDLDHLMAEAHQRAWPEPFRPRMIRLDKGALIIEPWDTDYAEQTVAVDPDCMESALLPPGAPFSRLWLHQGCWRPVARPPSAGLKNR